MAEPEMYFIDDGLTQERDAIVEDLSKWDIDSEEYKTRVDYVVSMQSKINERDKLMVETYRAELDANARKAEADARVEEAYIRAESDRRSRIADLIKAGCGLLLGVVTALFTLERQKSDALVSKVSNVVKSTLSQGRNLF